MIRRSGQGRRKSRQTSQAFVGFLQYGCRRDGKIIEVIRCPDYEYFACDQIYDFSPVIAGGAIAVRTPSPDRIVVYERVKGSDLRVRLARLSASAGREEGRSYTEMPNTTGYEIDLAPSTVKTGRR